MNGRQHIDLVPLGGLCNRMRAVASAVNLALKMDASLTIHWQSNAECRAYFDELFEEITLPSISVSRLKSWKLPLQPGRKKNLMFPELLRKNKYDISLQITHDRTDDSLIHELVGNRFYICSGHSLSNHFPLTKLFVPVDSIFKRINALKSTLNLTTVGVHIRRGDHKRTIAHTSEKDFIQMLDDEIYNTPDVDFYLATDSETLKASFLERYGSAIKCQNAELKRTTLQGMHDAIVDLWCLASTRKIIGSPFSSYSDLAAEIGKSELVYPK